MPVAPRKNASNQSGGSWDEKDSATEEVAEQVEAAAVGDAAPDAAVEPEADEAPAPADAVEDGEDKPKAVLLAEKLQAYLDAGYTHKQLHVQCGAGGLEKVCLLTEL